MQNQLEGIEIYEIKYEDGAHLVNLDSITLIYKIFQLEIREVEKLEKLLFVIMKIILCYLLITPKLNYVS